MTVTNQKRLNPSLFNLDPRIREGYYTDQYFVNVRDILERVAAEGYRFEGRSPALASRGIEAEGVDVGDIDAEMQCFTKREPFAVACGVDQALAILAFAAGHREEDEWAGAAADLEVEAVHDGARLDPWVPALKVRGRYREYGILETLILGVMAHGTAVATRTYELIEAAAGKPVFFFAARHDAYVVQSMDGYAYKVGVEAHNRATGGDHPVKITTGAQGAWFGGTGGGTTSHSYVLAFLKDCAESMLHFARLMPVEVPRVALVDTRGDCVGDSVKTAVRMFRRWWERKAAGRDEEARRYELDGVRCDTGSEVRDASIEPLGAKNLDLGVVPRLITNVRKALDNLHTAPDLPEGAADAARAYFRKVKIVASGGFDVERIRQFERLGVPVDLYGVGSDFLHGPKCDYTADVVRLKIRGEWIDFAKTGRRPVPNANLEPVDLTEL